MPASLLVVLLSATTLFAAPFTIGSMDGGGCYPFMCNDSGSNVGPSIMYQAAYNSSFFPGAVTVNSLQFQFFSGFGPAVVLGGTYQFWLGYSAVGLGLTSTLSSNWLGSPTLVDTVTIPAGGVNFGTLLTFALATSFAYNPATADLLLEVDVTNQDNVPNTSANGYNWADFTGTQVERAYCPTNIGCVGASQGALVTTFNARTTPEPGTLVMFGSGLIGLAGIAHRRFRR
jgi:hypothetical protein